MLFRGVFSILVGALIFVASAKGASQEGRARIKLFDSGASEYCIVVSEFASKKEMQVALELQNYIERISSVKLPIVTDAVELKNHEIILGNNEHLKMLGIPIDFDGLGGQGFTIQTAGPHVIIAGGTDQGTAYGIYTFLEKYLGCRWLTSQVTIVPKTRSISLPSIEDTQIPSILWREVFYADAMDPDFARHHKLNGNASAVGDDGRIAKEYHPGWNLFVHTFYSIVPPEKYFPEHPEYFSLVNGKRKSKKAQLCLTNPNVLRLAIENLRERMAQSPGDRFFSVSQMDWEGSCECDNCRFIDEREGSPMGSVLNFVNQVADAFPDKTISTLSYKYTRHPPKTMVPRDNVMIHLCTIECYRHQPLVTNDPSNDRNIAFREDMEEWSRKCKNIFIWDYVVQFHHLVCPFPNLRVLQPDMQFFASHNVKGIFSQGSRECGGEFAELRAYILAKLTWDPNCNVDMAINDFLSGYYGAAAPEIRGYIDAMHDALAESGKTLHIYGHPQDHRTGYLSEDQCQIYSAFFEKAEELVANNPELLLRVREAHMPLMCAILDLGYGKLTARKKLLAEIMGIAERTGTDAFAERNLDRNQFLSQMEKRFEQEQDTCE